MNNQATDPRKTFLAGNVNKRLLALNALMATVYFLAITFGFKPGNLILFYMLIAGEIFHLFQIVGFCATIWDGRIKADFDVTYLPPVDVFITVCGEPIDIVRQTTKAALAMDYPNFKVHILNDGFVANKDNWREIDAMALQLGVNPITRRKPGGAKAGNINNAMRATENPYVVVFDADHVPHADFLRKTMGYFIDSRMGFVQTPQYYKNYAVNAVATTAWNQQALFFAPIMKGKNRTNSAFMCGTNMVLNRQAIIEAGGMCEFNIAEDFLTSLFVHSKKWNSVYVGEVLAEGLSPEDFLSYYKQQYRWTRGSLEVIFKYNPLLRRGLSWSQRWQYLVSSSYYLSGVFVLIDALLPLIFLFTGATAVQTSTMTLAAAFLPYIVLSLYALQRSANFSYNFDAIAFSLSSFWLQIRAVIAVLRNEKTSFVVTSKQQVTGNFLYLTIPHIVYIGLTGVGLLVALLREGLSASLLANLSWSIINCVVFAQFIKAAMPVAGNAEAPANPTIPEANEIHQRRQKIRRIETVKVN